MTFKLDDFKEFVPLYLNNRLSADDRAAFEQAIDKDPELKRELDEFSEINTLYKEIEQEIPMPADDLFKRVSARIKSRAQASPSLKENLIDTLKSIFYSPRVSWAVTAVLLAVILFMAFPSQNSEKFKTLTLKNTYDHGTKINIVFDKEAKEKDIRGILTETEAVIISGPTPEGLYTILIKDKDAVEARLKTLRSSKTVKLAERSY